MTFYRAKCISLALVLGSFCIASLASPWEFSPAQTVFAASPGIFPHLEAAGRASIAVAGNAVAIVWEDNRDGTPRAYVAFQNTGSRQFQTLRLSAEAEAYAPVVAVLPQGGFLFGWEEAGQVWVRRGGPDGLEPPRQLSQHNAGQIAVAAGEAGVFAVWAETRDRYAAIHCQRLGSDGSTLKETAVAVTAPAPADQSYPALAVLKAGAVLAWEDRRFGHTVILYAQTRAGREFSSPQTLNELRHGNVPFGRGTGVARVALARMDTAQVMATWLDKRDFQGGYDVYAALSVDAGRHFEKNEMVQDEFGNHIGQWHAAIAAQPGQAVVAWDDDRDGSADVWISWRDANGWSQNLAVPGAAGSGPDTSPALTLDAGGDLHLVWLQQADATSPAQLRYVRGRRVKP